MRLPKHTTDVGDNIPRCPWCNGFFYDAKVDLYEAVTALQRIEGRAFLAALPVDCPDCGKPCHLDVELNGSDEQRMTMRPVRTEKDERFLSARGGA